MAKQRDVAGRADAGCRRRWRQRLLGVQLGEGRARRRQSRSAGQYERTPIRAHSRRRASRAHAQTPAGSCGPPRLQAPISAHRLDPRQHGAAVGGRHPAAAGRCGGRRAAGEALRGLWSPLIVVPTSRCRAALAALPTPPAAAGAAAAAARCPPAHCRPPPALPPTGGDLQVGGPPLRGALRHRQAHPVRVPDAARPGALLHRGGHAAAPPCSGPPGRCRRPAGRLRCSPALLTCAATAAPNTLHHRPQKMKATFLLAGWEGGKHVVRLVEGAQVRCRCCRAAGPPVWAWAARAAAC